ncbi:MAG TPA: hypothetical protein VK131_07815 [Candidatus Acidoferrales bacterium]|nr:hypothetical protein [Candidatus Acidoferrales bacterium]
MAATWASLSRRTPAPHGAVASHALGDKLVTAVLDDWRTAPIDERLRSTLGFLQKLTLGPAEVGPADAATVRAAGVSERALMDAIYVCALFNLVDRVADALGFEVPSAEAFARFAPMQLRFGYRAPFRRRSRRRAFVLEN